MPSDWRVLVINKTAEAKQNTLVTFAAETLDDFESAVLEHGSISLPLQFYDAEFAEWCELTPHAFSSLPRAVRIRGAPPSPSTLSPRIRASSLSGWDPTPPALERRSSTADGGGSALKAVRERSMSVRAIFLEDRLKTISNFIVAVVFIGFLLW